MWKYVLVACWGFTLLTAEEPIILTKEKAIQRAWACSPVLQMAQADVGMRLGDAQQACLYPNPILSIEVDDWGGSSHHKWDSTEVTTAISQMLEIGYKRYYRVRAACAAKDIAQWEFQVAQANTQYGVTIALIYAAAAQEKLSIACEQYKLAEEQSQVIATGVESGKLPLAYQTRARIAAHIIANSHARALATWGASKRELASQWNCTCPDFDVVDYPFFLTSCPPPLHQILNLLHCSPDRQKWQAEVLLACENMRLQEAIRIPDIEVAFGYTRYTDCNDHSFLFECSIPIPLCDRNQGNIRKAACELRRSRLNECWLEQQLEKTVRNLYAQWQVAFVEASGYGCDIVPLAFQTKEAAEEGFREGKYEYVDVLEARKAYYETIERYVDALVAYHEQEAELIRVLGVLR